MPNCFATVRHRTIRSKGCLSNRTALATVFKMLEGAQKSWRRLDGHNQLPKLVLGVTFNDGSRSSPSRPTVSPKPPPPDRPGRHQKLAIAQEGVAVTYDVAADFAVLCANCHRMIHKSDDPSDLNKFRQGPK
jgi:hypothetical protein